MVKSMNLALKLTLILPFYNINAIDLSTQTNFELQEFCINQTSNLVSINVKISILISAAQHLSIFEKESFLNEFCFVI